MTRLPGSLSHQSIRDVWHYSRDSTPSTAGAPGVDGVRAQAFASWLSDHIIAMRESIGAGRYRFSKLRMAPLPKPYGGYRIIAVPTVRDRLLQRALLRHLEVDPRFQATSPISFGFTKGKTLANAQRLALVHRQQKPWVLQVDIVKFFDQIQRSDIKELISRNVRRKLVAELLCAAVDCELEDGGGRGTEIAHASGIQKGRGLRQGMPVSPLLSNLLLKDFDEALSKQGSLAIRYADDIAVFGCSKNECRDALSFIQVNLAQLQLKIPDLWGGTNRLRKNARVSPDFSVSTLFV